MTEVVGPRLRRLLLAVLLLFALLSINSVYLSAVTFIEWLLGGTLQNYFYQWMFLGHLVLGVLLVVPVVAYALIHLSKAYGHRNRRAVKAGLALFAAALLLMASGFLLTRELPWAELRDPGARSLAYWLHVALSLAIVWLFVLHRLAGRPIRWRAGAGVLAVAAALSLAGVAAQRQDPQLREGAAPPGEAENFLPSLARTGDGRFVAARALMMDGYCRECHQDVHESWSRSMHRFSSFNNPVYLFSVRNTRDHLLAQTGSSDGVRLCAGCHDPVPLFSGELDHLDLDAPSGAAAEAGITCTACHAITRINSPRGNGAYTIEAPLHYPFAYASSPWLSWINRMLVKANPAFHERTFLKPLHRTAEFCGTCHKVHLPESLNAYRWLRAQNHYDSFLLSGVSGHGVQSFYYPEQAVPNCNACHMPRVPSTDFAARTHGDDPGPSVHDHEFAAANTAIPWLLGLPEETIQARRKMLAGVARVDIFGIRQAGRIDAPLTAPLPSGGLQLEPGRAYLLEVVIRTLKPGHLLTQGTADSNQLWLHLVASAGGRVIGESGAMGATHGEVDPWSHFVNAYVIDREGNRIEKRDPENIFTSLYDNQIPPGSADVVHYRLEIPPGLRGPVEISATLKYRKFDTTLLRHVQGEAFAGNRLPVAILASDRIRIPTRGGNVAGDLPGPSGEPGEAPLWERWNDYGIGLLRRGQLRQAEEAFAAVEALEHGAGALNLARLYLEEGRLAEAADALGRAGKARHPAPPWSVSYFTARLNLQNGFLDEAIASFRDLAATRFRGARERGFDFSRDYRLLNELARALAERAKLERSPGATERALALREEALRWYERTLRIDPENAEAHYGLALLHAQLGNRAASEHHRRLHARYKVDDNARDRAVQLARRKNPAADHAANRVVIRNLNRTAHGT